METKLKFIDGGTPLTNRVWFEMDEDFTKSKAMAILNEHICTNPLSMALEVHFHIENTTDTIKNNLIEILQEIYQIKVGYEKSFPIVSIYYPYDILDQDILERINACDQYRPGIRLYLMVSERNLPEKNSLSLLREKASEIIEILGRAQEMALDTTVYFFLDNKPEKLDQLLELKRLTYTWDTSMDIKMPLLQVSPRIPFDNKMVEKLAGYVLKEPEIVNILDTFCGLTSQMVRYRENKAIPTEYIPLGGCGVGVSEKKYYSNGLNNVCFFSSSSCSNPKAFDICKKCDHVSSCTGCFLMCNDLKECKLKSVFDLFSKML